MVGFEQIATGTPAEIRWTRQGNTLVFELADEATTIRTCQPDWMWGRLADGRLTLPYGELFNILSGAISFLNVPNTPERCGMKEWFPPSCLWHGSRSSKQCLRHRGRLARWGS